MMNRLAAAVSRTSPKNRARFFSSVADKVLVDVDTKSGICTMHLNSPPVNTLDSDLLVATVNAVREAEKNNDVRGIIVTSKFDGQVFCAGLNILDLYQKSHEHVADYWTLVQEWYLSWYGCSKPTLAVVNGHAAAGGCAFAMMCDYRIMKGGAGRTIGLTETRLGVSAPLFFIDLVRSTVGNLASEYVLLSAKMFQAEDALKKGLIDDVAASENLVPKAVEKLQEFMAIPQHAFHFTKLLMRQDNMKKLIDTRKDDAEKFAQMVLQPQVQKHIGVYVSSLKARKKT